MTKDQLRAAIRLAGLRATAKRVAVLGLLSSSEAPLSHAEILGQLGHRASERSTIYRNIIALVRGGLVSRTGRDTAWRFTMARDVPHARAHPHFVCTSCGRVRCLDTTEVHVRRVAGPGALMRGDYEIQLHGVCDECAPRPVAW